MINSTLEQVKIVVVGETSSWESVPQGSGSREKMFEWNFLLANEIQRQCGWFSTM